MDAIPAGKIDGVVDDGVGIGVYNAFQHAGRPIPAFNITADGQSLRLFKKLNQENGLDTTAIQVDAGMGSASFWEALALLNNQQFNGQAIPQKVEVPLVQVTPKDLDAWIAATPPSAGLSAGRRAVPAGSSAAALRANSGLSSG